MGIHGSQLIQRPEVLAFYGFMVGSLAAWCEPQLAPWLSTAAGPFAKLVKGVGFVGGLGFLELIYLWMIYDFLLSYLISVVYNITTTYTKSSCMDMFNAVFLCIFIAWCLWGEGLG